jgi:hypothetical protein
MNKGLARVSSAEVRMGFTHRFERDRNAMFTTAEGPITLQDICAHIEVERVQNGLGCAELIDARAALPDVSREDVRTLVALLRKWSEIYKLGPTAVVVSTDLAYGMLRMLDILVESFCVIQPFRDKVMAERWLYEGRGSKQQTEVRG